MPDQWNNPVTREECERWAGIANTCGLLSAQRLARAHLELLDKDDKRTVLLRTIEATIGQIEHLEAVEESDLDYWVEVLACKAVNTIREINKKRAELLDANALLEKEVEHQKSRVKTMTKIRNEDVHNVAKQRDELRSQKAALESQLAEAREAIATGSKS